MQIFRDVPYAIFTLVSYEILQTAVVNAVRRHKKKQAEDAAAAATTTSAAGKSSKGHTDGTKGTSSLSSSATATDKKTAVTRHDPITAAVSALFGNDNNKKLRNALCGSMAGGC